MNQEEEKLGTIYIATNLVNGKQYVGQTVGKLNVRKNSHYCSGNYLHNALKKYGIENFKWISFSCPEEDLDKQETSLIKELNTLAPNGYNLDSGGNKQKHRHGLSKQKQSENHADVSGEKHPMWGKHQSKETRQRMSDSGKGKHFASEETRQRMSESKSGENNPRARAVILVSPEGIEYNLPCCKPFCREHNLHQGTMSQVLQGKRCHHKGWTGHYQ